MSVGSIVSKPEYASAHGVQLIDGKLPVVFLTVFRHFRPELFHIIRPHFPAVRFQQLCRLLGAFCGEELLSQFVCDVHVFASFTFVRFFSEARPFCPSSRP